MSSSRSVRSNSNLSGRTSPNLPSTRSDHGSARGSPPLKTPDRNSKTEDRSRSPPSRSSATRLRDEDRVPSPRQSPRSSFQRQSEERRGGSPPGTRPIPLGQRAHSSVIKEEERPGSPKINARASFQRQSEERRGGSPPGTRPFPSSQRTHSSVIKEEERPGSPKVNSRSSFHHGSQLGQRTSGSQIKDDDKTEPSPRFPRSSSQRLADEERSSSPKVQPLGRPSQRVSRPLLNSDDRPASPSTTKTGSFAPRTGDELHSSRSSVRGSTVNEKKFGSGLNSSRISNPDRREDATSKSPPRSFGPQEVKFHRAAFERCLTSPEQRTIRDREKFNLGK